MSDDLNLPPFEESSVDSSATETSTSQLPANAETVAPPADDLFDVKINGKTFRVPREEVIAGYQRQQDYTRKAMQLAEERRQLEAIQREHAQFRGEREQIRAFLQNREALTEYLRQLQGYDSPDQPVTAGQLQQMVERQALQRQRETEEHFARMSNELEVKQTAADYTRQIDSTIAAALEQYPELKAVRRIEKILKEEVAERQPANISEALQLFGVVAKEQADGLRSFADQEKKRAAAATAKLSKSGIEPPGGTGVTKATPSFKLGSEELRQAFEESLRGMN